MSQIVLARKHRPKSFETLVGQPHVVKAITNALQTGRLHHAYLFTGTRGVGKTTISRILAKSLNCETGITDKPCGVCAACEAIDSGRFPDYIELDAASNRGVDEVQQLLDQAVYRPVQGRFKVFMIDEVHMLSNHAFNAMLKTLEEPPEHLKFVLATTDPQKVPVTVLSRCLQFNLRPMAADTVYEHLQAVLKQEGIPSDDLSLRILAQAARGSMRDALSLTDQAIAYCAQQLNAEGVRDMLGLVSQEPVFDLMTHLAHSRADQVLQVAEALRMQGISALSVLDEMIQICVRMAVIQASGMKSDASDPHPMADRILTLAGDLPADETQLLYSMCLHARSECGLAPDEHTALTMALLRFLSFRPAEAEKKSPESAHKLPVVALPEAERPVHEESVPSRVVKLSSVVNQRPSHPIPVAALEPTQPEPLSEPHHQSHALAKSTLDQPSQSSVTADWPQASPDAQRWVDRVIELCNGQHVQALVKELAMNTQWLSEDGEVWMLRTDKSTLNTASNRDKLQEALAQIGHAVELRIEVGPVTHTASIHLAAEHARWLEEAHKKVLADPYVQTLMREFGAHIVPGSIKPIKQ